MRDVATEEVPLVILGDAQDGEPRSPSVRLNRLEESLNSWGIRPFPRDVVRLQKDEVVRTYRRWGLSSRKERIASAIFTPAVSAVFRLGRTGKNIGRAVFSAFVVGVLLFILAGAVWSAKYLFDLTLLGTLSAGGIALAGVYVLTIVAGLFGLAILDDCGLCQRWMTTPWDSRFGVSPSPPPEVSYLVSLLQEAVPDAKIEVNFFGSLDPYLVVSVPGCRKLYLARWDHCVVEVGYREN